MHCKIRLAMYECRVPREPNVAVITVKGAVLNKCGCSRCKVRVEYTLMAGWNILLLAVIHG